MTSIKVAGIDILNQSVSPFRFVENDKRVDFMNLDLHTLVI